MSSAPPNCYSQRVEMTLSMLWLDQIIKQLPKAARMRQFDIERGKIGKPPLESARPSLSFPPPLSLQLGPLDLNPQSNSSRPAPRAR